MSTAGMEALVSRYEDLPHVFASIEQPGRETRLKQLTHFGASLLSRNLTAKAELTSFLTHVTTTIRQIMSSDLTVIGQLQAEDGTFQVKAFDAADDSGLTQLSIEQVAASWSDVLTAGDGWTGKLCSANQNDAAPLALEGCILPLVSRERLLGLLALGKRQDCTPTHHELECLRQICSQVAVVLENFLLHAELRTLKEGPEHELYCADPNDEASFEGIVGGSPALQRVLRQVEVVAPTDSGVLIQGETGTGKELIAQAIHNRSERRGRPFIKVNCAAIPSGLLESELFGHEKGAFTGAIARKAGRFELADKGTLFLDEVGDIPLELQAKLLRVLQEHEFERLGSTRTQQVDVRVIAATHRDLKQMVEEGTFRSDLYYRLHVFPLPVPALRDRTEDIPLIVRHFVDKYSQRMHRRIETIPARTMQALTNYAWPGNVRELQNFIERSVILSPGTSLHAPLEELIQDAVPSSKANLSTLEEMEREHVLRALKESNWVTGGPKGAATKLGMKRTTLAYRIRKLGIPVRPQM
jgi:formate hydrogenlyase transcriptional activator